MHGASFFESLRELRFGWSTLLGATLGLAIGASALPFYTAGLFIGHFETDFGWTRSQLSLVSLIGTLMLAVIAPIAGTVMDRFGVRGPAIVSYLWLAASFWLISLLQGSFAAYVAIQLIGVALIPGSTPIALTRPVNATFDQMRGLALGVAIGGIGATAAIAPGFVAHIIETEGWRIAFQRLSVLVLCGAPIVLILLSIRPPKAMPVATRTAPAGGPIPFRDPVFLRLAACFLMIALAVAGFVLHFVPLLTDRGMGLEEAARIQGILGVAVLFGRLGVGIAMDRFFAPRVAAVLLTITAAGLVMLAAGGTEYARYAAFAVGFTIGAEVDLIAYLTARYFGMARYGRMYGLLYGAFLIGTGVSPYVIAEMQAYAASYVPALWASAGLLMTAAALFLFAPKFPVLDVGAERAEADAKPTAP